jgi:hypothetical protein
MECPAPKMQRKERMLSLYEAADHVDVAEAVAEDPRIEVTITMDVQEEDEEEDETNIEDL